MRRATIGDADEIAAIINHPSVRPYIGGGTVYLDPSPLLADPRNICLFDEGGGQFFEWRGPGIYEAHSFYLVRGKDALAKGRECIAEMFNGFGASLIWRATPLHNRRARWFNRQLGFQSRGEIAMPHYGQCELFELGRE